MFNLVVGFGTKKDDYGVGDLLAEVSRRCSSISAEEREEIANISKRLRQHHKSSMNSASGSASHTPSDTPDSSQHDENKNHKSFGKDILKVDTLLRGFGSVVGTPNKQTSEAAPFSPLSSPDRTDNHSRSDEDDGRQEADVLLRGFGNSAAEDSIGDADSAGYGESQNL